jgi:hypothetical protein
MYYKVRQGFYPLLKNGTSLQPGAIVQLTEEEAQGYLHQLEEIAVEEKPATVSKPRRTKTTESE